MRLRGLIPIIILTVILGAVLALSTVLSTLNLPRITFEPEKIIKDDKEESENPKDTPTLIITNSADRKHTFDIEIADTPEKRALGLMNRTKLAENSGMLFIFGDEGVHGFWMKDTLIPLDLIHINNGEVVEIIENLSPCDTNKEEFTICPSYPASTRSKYSLEINAGTVEKLGIKVGDKVEIKL